MSQAGGVQEPMLVDGTHIRVDRPGEKEERKKTYTGKKKNHANNTTIISTTDNIIVGISKTAVGSTHDLKMSQGAFHSVWQVD